MVNNLYNHFYSFFKEDVSLADYLKLDESVILYYFQIWQDEEDPILKDLSSRFVNRKLFKYAEFDPAKEYKKLAELNTLFKKAGIDPEYYLVVDSSSDLPYDFYRRGEEGERPRGAVGVAGPDDLPPGSLEPEHEPDGALDDGPHLVEEPGVASVEEVVPGAGGDRPTGSPGAACRA